jgi:uncharacterized protein YbaP (TraB family)
MNKIKYVLKIVLILFTLNVFFDFMISLKEIYLDNSYNVAISGFNFNRVTVFEKNGKKIILVGMTHIANKSFYDGLKNKYKGMNAVTLEEGVSDNKKLLNKMSYKPIAKLLNIQSQPKTNEMFPNSRNADVDIDLMDKKETFVIADLFNRMNTISEAINYPENSPRKTFVLDQPKMFEIGKSDILLKRNKVLIDQIVKTIDSNNTVIVPWGALHLTEISNFLSQNGYKQTSSNWDYTHSTINIGYSIAKYSLYLALKKNVTIVIN